MTRLKAFLLVLLAWAVIYLPGLGARELKGEESRRILPALHMLRTGEWVVPVLAGEHYYNKPPGINWLIAGSFALTGRQDEWAARLPSVMFVLVFAAAVALMPSPWLGLRGSLVAAIVVLTCVGMYEKGRLIEIEAVYVCLGGLALLWWLNVYSAGGNRWLMWLPPSAMLAFGALIKGPFLAVPFYAAVIFILLYARRARELFRLPHLAGIALILVLCLGWVALASSRTVGQEMTQTWWQQLLKRAEYHAVDWGSWLGEVAKAPVYLLPWLIFLPLVWMKRFAATVPDRHRAVFKGLRLALIVSFPLLGAVPGTQSRYMMPALPLGCLLVGWILSLHVQSLASDRLWKWGTIGCLFVMAAGLIAASVLMAGEPLVWVATAAAVAAVAAVTLWRRKLEGGYRLSLATGLAVAVGTLAFTAISGPFAPMTESRRPAGQAINRCVPPGEPLYVYRSGHQPFLYYLRQPVTYLTAPEQIVPSVRYLLVLGKTRGDETVAARLSPRNPQMLAWVESKTRHTFHLLRLDPDDGRNR